MHLGEAIEEKRARRKEKKHRNRKRPAAIGLSGSEKQVMALQRYFGERNREDKSSQRAQRIQSVGITLSPLALLRRLSTIDSNGVYFDQEWLKKTKDIVKSKRADPEGGGK